MNVFIPNVKTTIDGHFSERPTHQWVPNVRGLHTFFICGKAMHHGQPILFLNRPMGNVIVRKLNHDVQQADHMDNYDMGQIMGGN